MASGTAPDIMMMYNDALVEQFYVDGGTYDLAPYLDGASQLKEYIGEECLSFGRNTKGEQFAIPARRSTIARTNAFIRKDWLDKLGLEVPKTVDELYNVLKMFKEKDPGQVGADKLVAYSGNGMIITQFLKNVTNEIEYLTASGFEVYADEGYKDYVRFRNKLYSLQSQQ